MYQYSEFDFLRQDHLWYLFFTILKRKVFTQYLTSLNLYNVFFTYM